MSRRSKKRKEEDEEQKPVVCEGEQDNLFSEVMREEIGTMWEIPQIFQFLHLTKESLNIPHFSIYEMERMLLIPRASKQLANIMTCLLSSPITKAKLRKVPPMPYEFWTNILAHKVGSWFKIYYAKHKDTAKVLETIGIEPEFWNIFPDAALLDGKDFENLSFKQRVWLLKTVCDTIMHTRKTVQEDVAKQPWKDQFETVLGTDRYGARYIYFPRFIPNDLRIYRHCLDNEILSTVKAVRSKQKMETSKLIGERLNRYRQRKLQSHNNSDRKSSRRENKTNEKNDKDVSSCKSSISATSSFINEDTNLSSSSMCSNNNNISLDVISKKRQSISSKILGKSALSNVRCSEHRDIFDDKSIDDESTQMFKGFANIKDNNYSIGIINGMLNDLKSEIDKEKKANKCKSSDSNETSQGNLLESCKNIIDFCSEISTSERDENERSNDNLSSSSKTDDEKLNEIISAEYSKLPETTYFKCISVNDNISDNSISKSDDEKLNETKNASSNSANENSSIKRIALNGSFHACSNDSEEMIKCKRFRKVKRTMWMRSDDSSEERTLRKRAKLRSQYRTVHCNENDTIKAEKNEKLEDEKIDKKDFSVNDMQLQEALDVVNDYINNCDINYYEDLQRSKELKTDECKQHFNKILIDLSVSDFQLVVDSVEGLRDLIASFSVNDSESNNTIKTEAIPACEIKLVTKLTELLSSLETIEATLKDATRKAKSKLQREWSNFKEGSVEDRDSSSESGLSSNWWVLGSQGRDPLSATGDSTLQTLSQFTLSSFGAQSAQQQSQSDKSEHKNAVNENTEQSCRESSERAKDENGSNEKQTNVKDSFLPAEKNQIKENRERREHKQSGQDENATNDKEAEQQTRRVLRARGVPSYTEQFYSDYESDENELEKWTDIEAVYASPSTQTDTSITHAASKIRYADDQSEQKEDSDQDWILPGSRKRKNKRSSANRRLKSFQNKVQNITENISENNVVSNNVLQSAEISLQNKDRTKLVDNNENKQSKKKPPVKSAHLSGNKIMTLMNQKKKKRSVLSDTICKIESVSSVHSELNIEADVIFETNSTAHYQQSNYDSTNTQQDYYYVVSQNPEIMQDVIPQGIPIMQQTSSTIVQQIVSPQLQQDHYVQPVAQPNYVIQSPNFLPIAQQQQSVFSQQSPRLITTTQPYINNANYIPQVIATAQSQVEYVVASGSMPNPQNPVFCTSRSLDKYKQNNRQPRREKITRGASPRAINPALISHVPQQRTPNSKPLTQQRIVPQAASAKSKVKVANMEKTPPKTENSGQKITSLIMLSDSDDEIEMIITEKTNANMEKKTSSERTLISQRNIAQSKQKPTVMSDIAIDSTKSVIPPQIIQRMSQGGISITPIKNSPPPSASNGNTQLVVVVNETGSHYALALPNGSKLILTPEQVAQIRASNGGKLIL